MTDWIIRHFNAMDNPTSIEAPTVKIFQYLGDAIEAHEERYGTKLANDYILGAAWLEIAKQVRVLLNGELGRLDGGTLDKALYSLAQVAGFNNADLDN
jgi:hypothetical protein